jgi:3D (Asp-Asp-Asp) domain-containing protein
MILNLLKTIMVTATIYHAVPEQTDNTPFITASGAIIQECCPGDHRWLAVSRDLELDGFVFGAKVMVSGTGTEFDGVWTVQDRMNRRYYRSIDFLVDKKIRWGKWYDVEIKLIND